MSQNTKIQWTDYTWNPVWGCNGGCNYCYARGIAKRFGEQMAKYEIKYLNSIHENTIGKVGKLMNQISSFQPTALNFRFIVNFPKKAKRIFVNSMSDLAFWETQWVLMLIEKIKENPDKIFQILTKFPDKLQTYEFPENVWIGITAETNENLKQRLSILTIKAGSHFISFEPLHGKIDIQIILNEKKRLFENGIKNFGIDWIIIGCETGQKRKKIDNQIIFNLIYDIKNNQKLFPIFVKQMEFDGKIINDNLPDEYNYREFPISA